eukprot:14672086-Alexandrium_andersonii.AAC.1
MSSGEGRSVVMRCFHHCSMVWMSCLCLHAAAKPTSWATEGRPREWLAAVCQWARGASIGTRPKM